MAATKLNSHSDLQSLPSVGAESVNSGSGGPVDVALCCGLELGEDKETASVVVASNPIADVERGSNDTGL
jgi:hypothetical protein